MCLPPHGFNISIVSLTLCSRISSFMSNYSSGEICMHCTCTLGSGVIRCKRLFPIACASPPPWKAPTDEFPEWGASNFQCRDKWTGLKHSASDILTRKRQSRSCKDKSHLKPTYQLAQWEVRIEMCDFLPPVTFVCSTQTSNRGVSQRRRVCKKLNKFWQTHKQ